MGVTTTLHKVTMTVAKTAWTRYGWGWGGGSDNNVTQGDHDGGRDGRGRSGGTVEATTELHKMTMTAAETAGAKWEDGGSDNSITKDDHGGGRDGGGGE